MSGEERLRRAVRRAYRARKRAPVPRPQPDSDWGWAVEDRLARLEDQQRWLMGLVVGTLLVALVQLALKALGLG